MDRFKPMARYLSRNSGLTKEGFEPSAEIVDLLRDGIKVRVVKVMLPQLVHKS